MYKLLFAKKVEYNKIIIETRLKSIDLSRLNVTAFDNSKNNIEKTNIVFKDSNLYKKNFIIFIYIKILGYYTYILLNLCRYMYYTRARREI